VNRSTSAKGYRSNLKEPEMIPKLLTGELAQALFIKVLIGRGYTFLTLIIKASDIIRSK
jgi:hypothetical protein